ncbi:hypothetical protein AYR62_14620 [Secundilactobacillus paracollinoides]|uniref:Uncharacterized protein n=1 Tax=Secundilactobacillus paracollinoides TaxID=240427 RepID=A0A1B2IXB0_9LACO|nr:hypothetical protein [Secundilactobacillus paracollinoides]ANZ65190.1 hypothetical protein AYR62_14620 [Secundilactobacillus paracollinoides]ANZ66662.1 hypothetical protein AYR63_05610 [Secundilactobacillus paracollinoides]KRL81525.1 hypothetical protein FC17_GL001665 [Secundilactobacillus paracollinoides DSM 15502 = JCM 11969]
MLDVKRSQQETKALSRMDDLVAHAVNASNNVVSATYLIQASQQLTTLETVTDDDLSEIDTEFWQLNDLILSGFAASYMNHTDRIGQCYQAFHEKVTTMLA